MPLIETINKDPGFHQMRIQDRFDNLPHDDKLSVIKMVEMGKSGEVTEQIELSDEGQEFVARPEFKMIYEQKTQPAEQPENGLMPVIKGLMQLIASQKKPADGSLNPEYAERVGGDEKGDKHESMGFKNKLADAFSRQGAQGLAATHRELFRDNNYRKFLEGK